MNRLLSIDLLRGFVMLLMTIDHARDMFSTINIGQHLGVDLPWIYYFTRWITHFCAPTFVFLSGFSIVLWIKKYGHTIGEAQWHIIKRGIFIVFLDITFASLLWTLIEKQSVFTFYLSELWAIGWSMILLALLLQLSSFTIMTVGIGVLCIQPMLIGDGPHAVWSILLYGNGEFELISSIFHVIANYAILPWFGIACIGYAAGSYFVNSKDNKTQQTLVFSLCAFFSLLLFIVLRMYNLYGDNNLFVYHSNAILLSLYSFFDVTKYPPSLQYTLVTLLLAWLTLIFSPLLDRKAYHPVFNFISLYGKTALFYYILHLSIIYTYAILLKQIYHAIPVTDNIIIIYLLSSIVTMTAFPILLCFYKLRNKYKMQYPLLSYM